MLDEIMLSEDGNYRVVAQIDDDPENPRNGENVGVMVCGHRRYDLGDKHEGLVADVDRMLQHEGPKATCDWLVAEHGAKVILPLYLTDHSGLSITVGGNLIDDDGTYLAHWDTRSGWDTGFVGITFVTGDAADGLEWAGLEGLLSNEVADYDLFLRGEVYDLRVQMKVVEHVTTVARYPAGSEEVRQRTDITWVDLEDQPHATVYGDSELGMIGADLLSDCLV